MTCAYHKSNQAKDHQCHIFEIGLGRTGSRSVCQAMDSLGLVGDHGLRGCKECKHDVATKYFLGEHDFDCYRSGIFHGNIACLHWRKLHENLPQAKFILTTRPIDQWLESNRKHFSRIYRHLNLCQKQPIGFAALLQLQVYRQIRYDEAIWREAYETHLREVIMTIPKDRLLVLDVFETEDKLLWDKLIDFLQDDLPKPISNISSTPFPQIDFK